MSRKNKVLVSVIVPVYNAENYLGECISSIREQTLKDIEILLVDNGSTDGSLEIIKKAIEEDTRVRLIKCPKSNAGKARNYGLREAQGEYLSFLDADDFFRPEMLEKVYEKAKKTNADVVGYQYLFYDDKTKSVTDKTSYGIYNIKHLPKKEVFSPEDVKDYLFSFFRNSPWNKMFRREFVLKNNLCFQEIARANDALFSYMAMINAKRISYVKKPFVYYRINNKSSLHATRNNTPLIFFQAYFAIEEELRKLGVFDRYKKSFLEEYMDAIVYYVRTTDVRKIRERILYKAVFAEEERYHILDLPRDYFDKKDLYDDYCQILKNDLNSKVVAVVVTRNRKELLKKCLDAIISQTIKPKKIILIDNDSNDGTFRMLEEAKYLSSSDFVYKKLEKNIGGAGGFYEGMKLANKEKPDWIWVMDDDVIPDEDCLEELLTAKVPANTSFLASRVVNVNNQAMNVPGLMINPAETGYADWADRIEDGLMKISNATFVSILIKNDAVNKFGLPVRDYFIWGDDTEYTTRLINHYGPAYLVGKSRAVHLRKNGAAISIEKETDPERIKMYYYLYRNTSINIRNYCGKKAVLGFFRENLKKKWNILRDKNITEKFLKIKTITKGELGYVQRKYDLEAFLNRFDKKVKYKEK